MAERRRPPASPDDGTQTSGEKPVTDRSAKRAVASPTPRSESDATAAGPSTAVEGERQVEAPAAREPKQDATAPTSGTRGGRPGSKAGPGGTPIARGGDRSTSSVPTMPGPTGPAQTTELVGDRGAGSEVHGGESGAAAGATAGVAVGGPVGALLAAPAGAAVGAAAGAAEDETAPPPGPVTIPGGGGTGPIDPIYDVARIQRREARRRRGGELG